MKKRSLIKLRDVDRRFEEMPAEKRNFRTQPLREQVYDYLMLKIRDGEIHPGASINLRKLSGELGISITPLRDALLQLEGAGLVTIVPRRGITLRTFTLKDVENYYDAIGMIEAHALESVVRQITSEQCKALRKINQQIWELSADGNFRESYTLNKSFHLFYMSLSDKSFLQTLWLDIWHRLYYSPVNVVNTLEWESICHEQHEELIAALKARNLKAAVVATRDKHWSFKDQRKYIVEYYAFGEGR